MQFEAAASAIVIDPDLVFPRDKSGHTRIVEEDLLSNISLPETVLCAVPPSVLTQAERLVASSRELRREIRSKNCRAAQSCLYASFTPAEVAVRTSDIFGHPDPRQREPYVSAYLYLEQNVVDKLLNGRCPCRREDCITSRLLDAQRKLPPGWTS